MKTNFTQLTCIALLWTSFVGAQSQAAEAEETSPFSAGFEAGTTGFGPVFSYQSSPKFKLSLSYSLFDVDDENLESDNVDYDADFDLSTLILACDWHPFENNFHASFGAAFVDHELDLVGRPGEGRIFKIGDGSYDNSQIVSLSGKAENDNSFVPYIGIGWNWAFGESGFGITTNLGALLTDNYKVELSATGPVANDPDFIADLRKEESEASDSLGFYPVAKVGFTYRF